MYGYYDGCLFKNTTDAVVIDAGMECGYAFERKRDDRINICKIYEYEIISRIVCRFVLEYVCKEDGETLNLT